MKTAQLMADQANKVRASPLRGHDGADSESHDSQSASRAWRRGSMAVTAMARKPTSPRRKGTGTKDQAIDAAARRNKRPGTVNMTEPSTQNLDDDSVFAMGDAAASSSSGSSALLCVQFPPRDPRSLSEMLDEDEANRRAKKESKQSKVLGEGDDNGSFENNSSDEDEATGFWRRAVPDSAVEDATSPVSRREPPSDRVRYIMTTRLGALPPTKRILDEYPIPKEILDALERHRHFHIDEFSLETSFDPIRISNDTTDGNNSNNNTASLAAGWECYVRRSVPLERKPVSFVLASLAVAPERPVPSPSDIFHQHVLAAASSEAAMLAEVRQLYDHVHDAYREFRSTLHRNLDVSYLVDLAFRSSLNSASFFLDDDDDQVGGSVVPNEVTVKIPQHLQKRAAAFSSNSSKWRVAKKGATRMSNRRGAIALNVKSEAATVVQRNEMVNKLTTFSVQEVRLMELWHSHDPENSSGNNEAAAVGGEEPAAAPLDPIPMPPVLSARFEAVWRELQMPAEERLDLAIKYSSLTGSTRLADAVTLWELSATLIREREELLRLVRGAAAPSRVAKSSAMVATEMAMFQDLTASSVALKEALVLTYVEVGDFVTYGGNFYLARMEYEATELRDLVLQSMDAAKRRSNEDAALSDGTKIGAQTTSRRTASD